MPKIIEIANTKIKLGESVKLNLNVARLPSHSMISIPVHVLRGKIDGPVLLFMAGMHGDEVNGVEIVRRIAVDKSNYPERGTIILIPILNIYGFLNYSRQVPDGKDVNRSFPGNKRGSLASRIAHLFMTEIFPHIDYGVDFHTGGGNRHNYPQIRCKIDIPSHFSLAKAFGAPLLLHSKLRDSSLRKEASNKGKPIIVYEAGEALRFDNYSIEQGLIGAKRIISHLGINDQPAPEPFESLLLSKSSWIRAQYSGLFRAYIKPGDLIKKNQILGTITDPYGAVEYKIKGTQTGYVVGLNFSPVISQGDALIHIGIQ